MVIDEGRFPGRQGRLLFAYLVAEQGRAVPRDELAEALWGDAPPATWDKALTVLVSKLRAVLSDGGIDGAGALTGAFGCYRLELPAGSRVDIVEAARAADEAETALSAGGPEQAKTAAALAETLVRQPFLPGDDGAWVEEKRRQIADVRVRALSVLAETSLSSGDAREAVKWSAEIVALEPFRESGYRQLMQAHVAAGNRAEALRVYERCRRLLADELGTYPSPETEAIYRGLLEQAPPGVVDVPTSGEEHQPDLAAAGATPRRKLGLGRRGARRRRGWCRRHLRHRGRRVARDGYRELDRRPRLLRFDRRHRPGRSATGRDHFRCGVSVGRQPGRPERDACRRLRRAVPSHYLCGEGADGVGRHENRSLGRRRDGWRFQDRPKLRPTRLHAPPGDAWSRLLLLRGVDA